MQVMADKLWADGWLLPPPPLSRVFMSSQGPEPASHQCILHVRLSPQRQLRSVMKTTSGLFVSCTKESVVGKSQKLCVCVSSVSLIRAALTALEMVPRSPEWAGKSHGIPA